MQSLERILQQQQQQTQSPHPYLLSNAAPNSAPTETGSSPGFLCIAGSESGSHKYDGVAGSNAPPPATFPCRGGGSSGGGGGPSMPKPKRKRSIIACKNCNERRVRCDGAINGLPCSSCKYAGKSDCQFIESKRLRGVCGRFESRDGLMGSSTSPTVASKRPLAPSGIVESGPPRRRARRHSITGTDGEEWRRLLQTPASVNRTTTGPATHLSEPRHLSWVVQEHVSSEKPLYLPTLMTQDDGEAYNREPWGKGAYVLPRYEVRDLLMAQYFELCHPTYPVLCKPTFLHSLQTNAFSHQLIQTVLMVSATHCDWAILQRAGYVSRRQAVESFYKRGRALWDGDVEHDKITNIQTMFLMQFWWRAVTDHKDPLWWLSGAIRMAQTMGLHRSAEKNRLNQRDKRVWRRIWWLLFLRDRQTASHFGMPMMIYEKDCDVEELEIDDFDGELDKVQALCLLEHVKLAGLMGDIIECEFSPGAARNLDERTALRVRCHHKLSEWHQGLPKELVYDQNSNSLYAMGLQIAFLAQILLLNRPVTYTDVTVPEMIRMPSETIAGGVADTITEITDDLVKVWGARHMSQHSMSCFFAATTVQMIKRRAMDPKVAWNADLKLRQNMTTLLQLDKILPMAGWIHRRYSRTLERENDSNEGRNVSISPPTMGREGMLGVPAVVPSQGTPRTTTKENNHKTNGHRSRDIQENDDEWGSDCGQLLNMEHALTDPSSTLQHHATTEASASGAFDPQHRQTPQPRPQQDYAEIVQDNVSTDAMQPEIFDYHWFMDNIEDIGNPFW